MADVFYRSCPSNAGELIAQLTKFYGWAPQAGWGLTGAQLLWWCGQANAMTKG